MFHHWLPIKYIHVYIHIHLKTICIWNIISVLSTWNKSFSFTFNVHNLVSKLLFCLSFSGYPNEHDLLNVHCLSNVSFKIYIRAQSRSNIVLKDDIQAVKLNILALTQQTQHSSLMSYWFHNRNPLDCVLVIEVCKY